MKGKGNNLMLGTLKDNLGVLREGVWSLSLFLTNMSLRITFSERLHDKKGSP